MAIYYPDKRVKRTKENFRTTLLKLMEEKCFRNITITEIVKAADYNRGTFYAHYEKKEDLLDEMIEEKFAQLTEAYRKPYLNLSVIDFSEIPAHSIVLFDHFLEHKRFYTIMLSPKTNYQFHEKLSKKLDHLFREEFEFSFSKSDSNIDIDLFSTYRIYGIIGLILEWIGSDFAKPSSYMAEQLIHILKFHTPKIYIKNLKE